MDQKEVRTYSAFLLVILLLILTYLIFKPYLGSILLSAVLALVFYPIYSRLLKHIKSKSICATITVTFALLVIIIPIAIVGFLIGKELISIYHTGILDSFNTFISSLSSNAVFSTFISNLMDKGVDFLSESASSLLLNLPSEVFQLIVVIFTMFSLLITGPSLTDAIKKMLPFKNKDELVRTIKDSISAIVYGFVIIALIDFIVAVIGLYILGIPHYMVWAIVIAFLVLIPFLGPTLFWIPYAVYLFVQDQIWMSIGMIVLGLLISAIETFGRPYIIGKKVNLHPIAVLVGVLGGLPIFGIVGIILGPVVVSITFILVEEFMKE